MLYVISSKPLSQRGIKIFDDMISLYVLQFQMPHKSLCNWWSIPSTIVLRCSNFNLTGLWSVILCCFILQDFIFFNFYCFLQTRSSHCYSMVWTGHNMVSRNAMQWESGSDVFHALAVWRLHVVRPVLNDELLSFWRQRSACTAVFLWKPQCFQTSLALEGFHEDVDHPHDWEAAV